MSNEQQPVVIENDGQPKRFTSVSVGDIVRLDGKRYVVAVEGFQRVADAV